MQLQVQTMRTFTPIIESQQMVIATDHFGQVRTFFDCRDGIEQ